MERTSTSRMIDSLFDRAVSWASRVPRNPSKFGSTTAVGVLTGIANAINPHCVPHAINLINSDCILDLTQFLGIFAVSAYDGDIPKEQSTRRRRTGEAVAYSVYGSIVWYATSQVAQYLFR